MIVLESAAFCKQPIEEPQIKQMALSNADKKRFRTIGHSLKPVVIVAQKGITENIKAEIERALKQHELIKIKLAVGSREARTEVARQISEQSGAEIIQSIGSVILILRRSETPDPKLSNLIKTL